ncbi:axin-1-like [Antedon mediterranea]|uniref:axin-1-like n=1 Tax=Antedon mediterranea TaxID=105859 RepID=UPI003AF9A04F
MNTLIFLPDSNPPTSLRPPVPGEENVGQHEHQICGNPSQGTPRRSTLSMGKNGDEAPLGFEPEGSDSITPPYTRWTESLHALLNDNDGIRLFTQFLEQEKEQHYLKFWLACQGYKMRDEKNQYELSKLICKKFIKQNAQTAIKLNPNTRTIIEENVKKGQVAVELFDEAQSEAENFIRDNLYPEFLKSELYVQYANNGGLSTTSDCSSPTSSYNGGVSERFLTTVVEDEELQVCQTERSELFEKPKSTTRLTAEVLSMSSRHRLISSGPKRPKRDEYRHFCRGNQQGPINPYHASLATAAPAASTNDSERQSLSSDAVSTDDTMSLTDSSVDGRPIFHRHNIKKIKRHMRRSVQVNGHVQSFPPFPCPRQPLKESRQLTPDEFVRQLTEKLEQVKKERETQERLQARLKEVEEADSVISEEKLFSGLETLDEDPSSILDDHCARVFTPTRSVETPNRRRSPGHITPKSKSPEQLHKQKSMVTGNPAAYLKHSKSTKTSTETNYDREHGYDHRSQIHMYSHNKNLQQEQVGPYPDEASHYYKSRNESTRLQQYSFTESRTKREKQSSKKSDISSISKTTDSGIYDGSSLPSDGERNKAIVQWLAENEPYNRSKQSQKSSSRRSKAPAESLHAQRHSNSGNAKKPVIYNAARPSMGTSKRSQWSTKPCHPFMQDTSMPINTPPEPGTVLEEARRRMHVDERHRKNLEGRRVKTQMSSFAGDEQHVSSTRVLKTKNNSSTNTSKDADSITIAYFYCNDPIPYRTNFPNGTVTLAQFKQLISRKGNYRYSFKTHSDEFDSGVVHEIISDDFAVLPHFKGKIIGKVESVDS